MLLRLALLLGFATLLVGLVVGAHAQSVISEFATPLLPFEPMITAATIASVGSSNEPGAVIVGWTTETTSTDGTSLVGSSHATDSSHTKLVVGLVVSLVGVAAMVIITLVYVARKRSAERRSFEKRTAGIVHLFDKHEVGQGEVEGAPNPVVYRAPLSPPRVHRVPPPKFCEV